MSALRSGRLKLQVLQPILSSDAMHSMSGASNLNQTSATHDEDESEVKDDVL